MRPKYACPKGRTGVMQAKAPAHLLEGSWPTEALLAQIAVAKHSEHMPLNRQAVAMARLGVPIERAVLADWMGRTGALIAPVVDRMALLLKQGGTRLYVDETTAPVLDPGRGKTKTGYLWAVLRDDRGWNGPAPPGVVFHYRPGRKGEYADEILMGFDGTIQGEEGQQTVRGTVCPTNAYGGYSHLTKPEHVLDLVAFAVEFGIVLDEHLAVLARRNAWLNISINQCVAKPVGIITAIRQQGAGLRDL